MKSKHNPEERDAVNEGLSYQGCDPIVASWKQSPAISKLWLKNGESQTTVQRIGFSIISLFLIGFGIDLAFGALDAFKGGDHGWVVIASICLVFLYLGLRGLRNVFRLPRK